MDTVLLHGTALRGRRQLTIDTQPRSGQPHSHAPSALPHQSRGVVSNMGQSHWENLNRLNSLKSWIGKPSITIKASCQIFAKTQRHSRQFSKPYLVVSNLFWVCKIINLPPLFSLRSKSLSELSVYPQLFFPKTYNFTNLPKFLFVSK